MIIKPYLSGKKGSITLTVITLILVIVVILIYLFNLVGSECDKNSDCSENSYCGADNECHEYPPQVVVKENNFLLASIVFGVCLIVAAIILRKK
ncbi:MAG: hypothetical protein ABIH82_04020 [Candidatus Woesearchaeota archaeon]